MKEYISRWDALKELDKKFLFQEKNAIPFDEKDGGVLTGLYMAIRTINSVSSADVAPVRHGTWEISMKDYNLYDCSNCHKVTMFETWGGEVKPYGYCPNCGAKMDGGDDVTG